MQIRWARRKGTDTVRLHPRFIHQHNLTAPTTTVHFGAWNREMRIQPDPGLAMDHLGLPLSFKDRFTIPAHLPYEVRIHDREIHIGPVIGYIAFRNREGMTPQKLNRFIRRLSGYETIQGLIYLCSADSINTATRTIKGYYYDPSRPPGLSRWVKGVFPYPGSVYKRIRIPNATYVDLVKVIGEHRIFNHHFFHKLDLWKIMQRDPEAKKHLPHTEELNGRIQQLDRFLTHFGNSAYLKPAMGSQGWGVIHVKKIADKYRFLLRGQNKTSVLPKEQAIQLLNRLRNQKTYLIQQAVEMKHGDRRVDFRAYMQKNSQEQWICKGMIARFAKKGSVITNLANLEKLQYARKALSQIYQLNLEQAGVLERQVGKVCCEVCGALDRVYQGHYGDVAIDLVIDRNKNVWILEINKKYSWYSLHRMRDTKIMGEIMSGPFRYAKALAGFTPQTIRPLSKAP
ncbi:YheC/YheD family endospore coat-associated protein [Salinithrix halophila]|uniref:YheC/YheD family protein n=1 Tax=Salinithrix halophila TaxID=1485204 RepID=A0ABV8JDS4_9BACL